MLYLRNFLALTFAASFAVAIPSSHAQSSQPPVIFSSTYNFGINGREATAADINGDGSLDLVAADISGTYWAFLRKQDGSFSAATLLKGGSLIGREMAFHDGNRDGYPEFFTTSGSLQGDYGTYRYGFLSNDHGSLVSSGSGIINGHGNQFNEKLLRIIPLQSSFQILLSDFVLFRLIDPMLPSRRAEMHLMSLPGESLTGVSASSVSDKPFSVQMKQGAGVSTVNVGHVFSRSGVEPEREGLLGLFSSGYIVPGLYTEKPIRIGDLDRDGLDDIVAVLQDGTTVVFFAGKNITLVKGEKPARIPYGFLPTLSASIRDLQLGDIDSDGDTDAVIMAGVGQRILYWIENRLNENSQQPFVRHSIPSDGGNAGDQLLLGSIGGSTGIVATGWPIRLFTGTKQARQCADGSDNDGDGLIDFPNDPGCVNLSDSRELDNTTACSDGIDNDGDGFVDLSDPGCTGSADLDERDPVVIPACKDTIDNDGDGFKDFPSDPGCQNESDTDESNAQAPAQCSDRADNDADGKIDLADPGCYDAKDTSEVDDLRPIFPFAECISENGDGTFNAYFGYENGNNIPVQIQSGISVLANENAFTPGDANRGQPSLFKPGRHRGVFSLRFNGDKLRWSIKPAGGAQRSTEVSRDTTRCVAVRPILECVSESGAGAFEAFFHYFNSNPFAMRYNIGARNRFSPGTANRGQPIIFESGFVKQAFSAKFAAREALQWRLDDQVVEVNAGSPRCKITDDCASVLSVEVTGRISAETDALYESTASLARDVVTFVPDLTVVNQALRLIRKSEGSKARVKALLASLPFELRSCVTLPNGCQSVDNDPITSAVLSELRKQWQRFRVAYKLLSDGLIVLEPRYPQMYRRTQRTFKQANQAVSFIPRYTVACPSTD